MMMIIIDEYYCKMDLKEVGHEDESWIRTDLDTVQCWALLNATKLRVT
jgi:hypothetical protein